MAIRSGPVSVTCRTESRRRIHERLAAIASVLAIGAMLALVVLTIFDTDPVVTGLVVIATLGLSLLTAASGRAIDLPAVTLTADDEMVHFGNHIAIHSFPLNDLLSVKQSTELSTGTFIARSIRADQIPRARRPVTSTAVRE